MVKRLIIPPKIHIIGNVKAADTTITMIPILPIGIKNDITNKINVNPAKNPKKIKKYLLNVIFENTSNPKTNKNQEMTNRTTMINNIVFCDRFFKPEINLILKSHRHV